MNTILFCDLLLEKGNRNIDNHVIKIMSETNQVHVLANDDFDVSSISNLDNVYILDNKYGENKKSRFAYYRQVLLRTRLLAKYIKQVQPDLIYISVYHTNLFFFGLPFLRKYLSKIVILENYNIDSLIKNTDRIFYSVYKNCVNHLVYEPYFKDYLCQEVGVREDKVFVMPHMNYAADNIATNCQITCMDYDCVSLSGSVDESVIEEIVRYEEKHHFFATHKIKCFIKSKLNQYESEYLTVKGGFIETKDYERMYHNSKVILIPFPLTYKYRMSGCVVDSFSHHKPVVSTNFMLAKYYHNKYGNIISPCNNTRDMLEAIKYYINKSKIAPSDFIAFENDHGYKAVKSSIQSMIIKIKQHDNH